MGIWQSLNHQSKHIPYQGAGSSPSYPAFNPVFCSYIPQEAEKSVSSSWVLPHTWESLGSTESQHAYCGQLESETSTISPL